MRHLPASVQPEWRTELHLNRPCRILKMLRFNHKIGIGTMLSKIFDFVSYRNRDMKRVSSIPGPS